MLDKLPPLVGSAAQIKWASVIRDSSLEMYPELRDVVDASWWISNRDLDCQNRLDETFVDPLPHQRLGGPPPPKRKLIPMTRGSTRVPQFEGQRDFGDADASAFDSSLVRPAERKPHEAELFAASVSRTPKLAEMTILALLARVYKGEVQAMLRSRVSSELETVRADIIADANRDVDGIYRILGTKQA